MCKRVERICQVDPEGWYAPIVGEELIRCRECKHRMHDRTCIKVMKRKPDDGYCDEGEVKQY